MQPTPHDFLYFQKSSLVSLFSILLYKKYRLNLTIFYSSEFIVTELEKNTSYNGARKLIHCIVKSISQNILSNY